MSYSDLLAKTRELVEATQVLGALGAELRLRQMGSEGDPLVRDALQSVLNNLDPPSLLDGLEPGQVAAVVGRLTYALQEALDLVQEPERAPGWGYTDRSVLQERGRGSRSIAQHFAKLARDRPALETALADGDFLDIGVGVGWLAIEAAGLWPRMRIVGLDIWEPSLKIAAENIAAEGLQDRISLRKQSINDFDDQAAFNVIWLPSLFLPRGVVESSLPSIVRALRPGGFLLFSMAGAISDPLSHSLANLLTVRSGGYRWPAEHITQQLRSVGFSDIEAAGSDGVAASLIIARRE